MHVRIPILLPGLTADGLTVTRSATLPELTMGLRDRIATERDGTRAAPATASRYYRKRLLEEVDLSEFADALGRRSGARGWSASSAGWSAARAPSSRPPSARA